MTMPAKIPPRIGKRLTYQAEKPCPQGHPPIRYYSNGVCTECARERAAARYAIEKAVKEKVVHEYYTAQQKAKLAERERARKARALALELGVATYNGRPCKQGHPGLRYAKSQACVECMKLANGVYYSRKQKRDMKR